MLPGAPLEHSGTQGCSSFHALPIPIRRHNLPGAIDFVAWAELHSGGAVQPHGSQYSGVGWIHESDGWHRARAIRVIDSEEAWQGGTAGWVRAATEGCARKEQ